MKSIWSIKIAGRLPMIRVRQFINNPFYIWHFLKRFFWYKNISHRFIPMYKKFTFLNSRQTIDKLIDEKLCLARFSDGEIDLLTGMGVFDPNMIWSQPYSKALRGRLIEALTSKNPRLLIAHTSPEKFLSTREASSEKGISYTMWTDSRMYLHTYLREEVFYGDAHSFIPQDHPDIDWEKIKTYLKQHDVIVVTGGVDTLRHLSLGRKTFFVEAGKHDAFSRYDEIMFNIKKVFTERELYKDSTLIMISLGPTASVLSVDLCDQGYLVWDSGHIFKYAANLLV